MHGILNNADLRRHSFSKRPEARRHELKLHLEELLLHDGRNVNLDLEVEHVVRSHTLGDLEEVLLPPAVEIVDQEAARVPIILRPVKDFELDESGLTGLHRRVVLVLRTIFLLRHVLDVRQILDVDSLFLAEHGGEPRAPVFLGRDPRQLNIVLEAHHVLLPFLHDSVLLLLSLDPSHLAGLLLHPEFLLLLDLLLVEVGHVVLQLHELLFLSQAVLSI